VDQPGLAGTCFSADEDGTRPAIHSSGKRRLQLGELNHSANEACARDLTKHP
jgi:hypothetical protein